VGPCVAPSPARAPIRPAAACPGREATTSPAVIRRSPARPAVRGVGDQRDASTSRRRVGGARRIALQHRDVPTVVRARVAKPCVKISVFLVVGRRAGHVRVHTPSSRPGIFGPLPGHPPSQPAGYRSLRSVKTDGYPSGGPSLSEPRERSQVEVEWSRDQHRPLAPPGLRRDLPSNPPCPCLSLCQR